MSSQERTERAREWSAGVSEMDGGWKLSMAVGVLDMVKIDRYGPQHRDVKWKVLRIGYGGAGWVRVAQGGAVTKL
jgi:hypothetical protein